MKKYWQTFKTSVQNALTYRSTELVWVISASLTPLLFLQIWSQNDTTNIPGFNISEIVTYYFVMIIITQLTTPHIEWNVANNINTGDLNFYLLKPLNYLARTFIREIPFKLIAYVANIIPIAIFLILYRDLINVPALSASRWILVGLMCTASYVLIFIIQFCIGCLAFWMTNITAVMRVFYMLFDFFSGRFFPLALMPLFLKSLSLYLPFQYFWYVPTMFVLQKEGQIDFEKGLLIMIAWLLVFGSIAAILWKKGIKSYSSFGG